MYINQSYICTFNRFVREWNREYEERIDNTGITRNGSGPYIPRLSKNTLNKCTSRAFTLCTADMDYIQPIKIRWLKTRKTTHRIMNTFTFEWWVYHKKKSSLHPMDENTLYPNRWTNSRISGKLSWFANLFSRSIRSTRALDCKVFNASTALYHFPEWEASL